MEAWWDNIDADGRRRNYRERLNWSQLRDRRCASASRGPSFLHRWWGISSPKWPFRWRSPPSDACLNLSNSMALNYLSRFSYWYICRPLFILSYFILLFFWGGRGNSYFIFMYIQSVFVGFVCVCVCFEWATADCCQFYPSEISATNGNAAASPSSAMGRFSVSLARNLEGNNRGTPTRVSQKPIEAEEVENFQCVTM